MRFGDKLRLRLESAVSSLAVKAMVPALRFVETVSMNPWFTPPRSDAKKLLDLYNESPWVRSIVSKIGKAVAKQAWYLEDDNGERDYEHVALEFLKAGCPKLRGRQAMALTITYIDLAGEAFWALGRDGSGALTQYAPIPPHWVVDIPHLGQDFYRVQPRSGVYLDVPQDQMLWFRDVDPADPYGRGRSITAAAWTELQTDEAAAEMLYAHFKNRAQPDIIVSGTADAPLTEQDRRRGEAAWNERFLGPKKAGRAFWSSRPLNTDVVGSNLRDNEMSKVRDQLKATILEVYGVPPEIFGRLGASNRATIDVADLMFGKHTLEPRLTLLLDFLEPFLDEEFQLDGLELGFDSPVKEDGQFALAVMTAFPSKFTGNEVRDLAGRKKSDAPGMDDLNEPPAPAAGPGGGDPNAGPPAGKPPKDEPAKALPAPVAKGLSPQDIVTVSSAHEDPQVRAEATMIMDRIFGQLLQKYGADLLAELETEVNFELNMRTAEWLQGRGLRTMQGLDETTRRDLEAALVEGVADGADVDGLAAIVDSIFEQAASARADMIGTTEATHLTGFATQAAAEQGGFGEKMWLSSHDQVVRDSHKQLDGQVVQLSDDFQAPSGARAQFPGDFGDAAEDINCRCAIRPVLPGEAKMSAPEFRTWHATHYQKASKKIRDNVAMIFSAQAEVVKAQLKRVASA